MASAAMAEQCVDRAPFPCTEAGCPAPFTSCYMLANKYESCGSKFADLFDSLPDGVGEDDRIGDACAASCRTCSESQLRATVAAAAPAAWPWPEAIQLVERIFAANLTAAALAARIANAATAGPLIIRQAYGERFRPAKWNRDALRARCAPAPGAPPPAPPWPTIAYREPAAVGKRWAGLHFDNGATQGVRDVVSLLDAQDTGRLRGVVLFDSPANRTCAPVLLRSSTEDETSGAAAPSAAAAKGRSDAALSAAADALPAPRFFPRDYEIALGGEGMWRKGGVGFDDPGARTGLASPHLRLSAARCCALRLLFSPAAADPEALLGSSPPPADLFVSKAGTQTHVHIDAHCARLLRLGPFDSRPYTLPQPPSHSSTAEHAPYRAISRQARASGCSGSPAASCGACCRRLSCPTSRRRATRRAASTSWQMSVHTEDLRIPPLSVSADDH